MLDLREVEAPYPGLRPFESHEGEIYFGRETHTDALVDTLQREHFLAVVGPSGSGKSSLVRAGLLPALAFGTMGTGVDWRIAVLRPGNQPLRRLAQALLSRAAIGAELIGGRAPEDAEASLQEITADVAGMEAELRRGALGLVHTVAQARRSTGAQFNLLVLVDQFEEIFTYAAAGGAQGNEAEAFVNLLLAACTDRASRVHVAITMRTDFLGNCVRFLDLPEAINKAQYLTPRLTREQLEKAIVGPARVFGGDVASVIVPDLINAVADNPDQLPILQHALACMWSEAGRKNPDEPLIDRDVLDLVGGVREALNEHAEQIYKCLSDGAPGPPGRDSLATQLFQAITERRTGEGGGQEVRRPQTLARIAAWTGEPWQDFVPIVRAFSGKGVHFLQHGRELNEQSVIDISHEALIRQWQRLRAWVATESDRASDYMRWRQLEADQRAGLSGMLTGVDLARAGKWLGKIEPTADTVEYGWRPTARWARRYAQIDGTVELNAAEALAKEEFERIESFIAQSIEEAGRTAREAVERKDREQRLERERLEALAMAERERAAAAEREREQTAVFLVASKRQSRRFAWLAMFAVLCAVAAGAFAYKSTTDRDRANAALHQSNVDRVAAIDAKKMAEANRARELEQRKLAEEAQREAEKATSKTEVALRSAQQAEATAKTALAATAVALDKQKAAVAESNQAKSVAEEQRALAQRNEANTRDALRQATTLRLGIEGQAIATQARQGSTLQGALMARVAHRYQPGGEAYGGLLAIADYLHRTRRIMAAGATSVAFSPDGKRIVSGSYDNTLRLWEAESGKPVGEPFKGHTDNVWSVAFSPDGKRIVSGSADNTLRLWEAESGKPVGEPFKGHTDNVWSVAFSPDGKRIVSGSADNTLRLWEAESGKPVGEPFKGHKNRVSSVAFSPDGKRIISGSWDNTLRLWEAESGKPVGEPFKGYTDNVWSVAFSPDGKRIVSGSLDNTLQLWEAENGKPIGEPLRGHTNRISSVAFSPDGKRIVSGSWDNTLRLWEAESGKPVGEPLRGHTNRVSSVAFSPDGKRIVSGSLDNTLQLWEAENGKPVGEPLRGHTNRVLSVAFSPDGKRIISGSLDNTLWLWEAESGKPVGEPFKGHMNRVSSVAFSPDGKRIVSGSYDNTLRLWEAESGKPVGEPFKGHMNRVSSVAFSPDGKRIISGSADNTLRLWEAESGKPVGEPFKGHTDNVWSVAFSPDGKRIVSGSADNTLRLWEAESGKPVGEPFKGHMNRVSSVAFSRDGKRIISGSLDNTLRLWEAESGKPVGEPLRGHTNRVSSVAFSPDGKRIVSGSYDNTLRLWEAESGKPVGEPLRGHTGAVSSVAFSPDGKRIVSGSADNTLRRWPLPEVLDAEVCAKLPRNMTRDEWKKWVGDLPYRRQCPDLPGPPDDP